MVPPRERKKVIEPLAAPSSRSGTAFCTTRTRFCIEAPTPTPTASIPKAM